MKRELKGIQIYGCRCDQRLQDKTEGSTRLAYTGLCGGLGHLKIETRLRDERFESVKGEYVIYKSQLIGVTFMFRLILSVAFLVRMCPT